jgi:hypothetical protein
MFSILTQEFHSSLPLDNGLLVDDIKNGVQIEERDIVDVAINARTLFVLATLTCREQDKVAACFKLWVETAELIAELVAAWSQVEVNDPRVGWLMAELKRLETLCDDRVSLYKITAVERRRYTEVRKDVDFEDSFSQRHGQEAKGWADHSSPAHIYSTGHF